MKQIRNKAVACALAAALALSLLPAAYGADTAQTSAPDAPEITVSEPVLSQETEEQTVPESETDTEPESIPEAEPVTEEADGTVVPGETEADTESPALFNVDFYPEQFKVTNISGTGTATFTWSNPSAVGSEAKGFCIDAYDTSQPTGSWVHIVTTINRGNYGDSWVNYTTANWSGMEHRKDYLFRAYYVSDYWTLSSIGNLVITDKPITCTLKEELLKEKKGEMKAASGKKGSVAYQSYNELGLSKGSKAVFDRGLYRLTLQVTKVTGSAFTVKGTFQNKFAKELNLDCGRVSYLSPSGGKTKTVTTKSNSFTYTASMADLALGCNYLKFSVEALGGNTYGSYRSTECLYFNILPGNYTLALNNAKANRERITLFKAFNGGKNTTYSGTIVYYRKKGAKKWIQKTFARGKTISLPKLKANTVYQIRMRNYVRSVKKGGLNGKGKTFTLKSPSLSNVLTVRTAMAKGPAIKSIKVNKVKVSKVRVKGYWDSNNRWHSPYTHKITTYKMTVTLKSNGSKGLIITNTDRALSGAAYFKGSGKKFVITGTYNGNRKGKAVKMKFATCNNYSNHYAAGISSYVTKKVRLK